MGKAPQYPTHRDPDRPPPLPFVPGEVSNGEFVPGPVTARDRAVVEATLRRAADAADRLGLDRRRFLQSAGGMAAMLTVVNLAACSSGGSESSGAGPGSSTGSGSGRPGTTGPTATGGTTAGGTTAGTTPGGTYEVPDPTDLAACEEVFAGTDFIVDVHTHHVMPTGIWRRNEPAIESMIRDVVPASCTEADPLVCVDRRHYVADLLLGSDTSVAMLSDVPSSGGPLDSPLPYAEQVGTRELARSLAVGGEPRVLVQAIVAPNFSDQQALFDQMTAQVESGDVATFKTYTAWGPRVGSSTSARMGYALDDPVVGLPWLDHARSLGVKVICAHKGLPIQGFDERFNGPRDIVAAARAFPDMQFVVFHSAFERATTEGPYDPSRAGRGTNALIKAMDDLAMPPNSNVWCELGTTWRETMADPTQAAHVLGKLLTRMGERRVLWGTDAVWYGSPQPQIMAFRTFQISPEFQQRFGYPALTPELKARVFGLNAADLLGLDPAASRCAIDASALAQARIAYGDLHRAGELREPWSARAPLTRRQVLTWLTTDPHATLNPF